MNVREMESVIAGLKYDISRLHVRVLALEGRGTSAEMAAETGREMSESDALFWCRVNHARIAFTETGVSVSVGEEGEPRTFSGKNLSAAATAAKEFIKAEEVESLALEEESSAPW